MKQIQVHIAMGFVSLFWATQAGAQFLVEDPANLGAALQQVAAWRTQYMQMVQQYQSLNQQLSTAKQALNTLSGSRNLGNILTNPALNQVVAPDLTSQVNGLSQNGARALSPSAQALRQKTMIYNCEDKTGTDKTSCEASLNINAEAMANEENTLNLLTLRSQNLSSLQDQINLTSDAKAIAELQARIAIEQANIQNDSNKIAVMNALFEQQRQASDQTAREHVQKMLSSTAHHTSSDFVYQLPVTQ